ncbi:hypothetical protein PINS_up013031 [Pythium insidiosum]|nr:hypothetical protein PINS_up013031 [Pythium insidiosum]
MSRRRTWNSAWQQADVASDSSALRKLTEEIEFAFRDPREAEASPAAADRFEALASILTNSLSGDYLFALESARALRLDSRNSRKRAALPCGPEQPPSSCSPRVRARSRKRALPSSSAEDPEPAVWVVNDLRQQVQRLREHVDALQTRAHFRRLGAQDRLVGLTRTYFEVFRNGLILQPTTATPTASCVDQLAFVRNVMDEDVVTCSCLSGLDQFIDQWRRYAQFFRLYDYTLHSIELVSLDDRPIVRFACSYKVRITLETLAELFPHIVKDGYFVCRLVGRELLTHSRVTFYFNADGRIERYDDESDFVTAFSQLLRDPKDLAHLMGHALIREQSIIGDV